jgi:uncharacterized membrane protein YgcG
MPLRLQRFPPLPKGKTQGWRSMALVLILCVVTYGFWKNAERQMEVIGLRGAVMDEVGILSKEQLNDLREMVSALKENYGVKTSVLISKDDIEEWHKESSAPLELFIVVVPSRKEAAMSFSPLLRRGLDEEFCYRLLHEILEPQVREEQIFNGLAESLSRLWRRLGNM